MVKIQNSGVRAMRKVYLCSWIKFFGKSNSDGLKAQKPCLSPKIGHDKPIIKPKNIIQNLKVWAWKRVMEVIVFWLTVMVNQT